MLDLVVSNLWSSVACGQWSMVSGLCSLVYVVDGGLCMVVTGLCSVVYGR